MPVTPRIPCRTRIVDDVRERLHCVRVDEEVHVKTSGEMPCDVAVEL
jgi:hypothetical protein